MPDAAAERREDLARIRGALELAADVIARFSPGTVAVREKDNGSPVTDADLAADEALRRALPAGDEGWLSEETPDDPARLARRRVWVVDPLDGTREFLAGLREWCVSIALVEDRVAVAGGIYAPALGELYLGAPGVGATLDGEPLAISRSETLAGTTALLGRWALSGRRSEAFAHAPFSVRPVGAAAYTLALVAAGRGDAHWSRGGKAEWDVAAGVALVTAAGGRVTTWDGATPSFNAWPPRIPGIVACAPALQEPLRAWLSRLR